MIRVVIADDHAVVRNGLRHILERESDVGVVGEASKASEVSHVVRETSPDVILLDLSMPGRSGLELVRLVRTDHPATRILVLTMHAEEQYVVRAFRAGAAGYLTKDSAATDLIDALRKVAGGGTYVSPEMAEKLALGLQERPDAPPYRPVGPGARSLPPHRERGVPDRDRRGPLRECENRQYLQDAPAREVAAAQRRGTGALRHPGQPLPRRLRNLAPWRQRMGKPFDVDVSQRRPSALT